LAAACDVVARNGASESGEQMSSFPDVIREGSSDGSRRPATEPYERGVVEAAIAGACKRIAPLWPLKHFVAVNPFLGFTAQTFHATCATMHRVARVDMLMPRAFYRNELAAGNIEDRDLEAARKAAPGDWHAPATLDDLKAALARDVTGKAKHAAIVATVAEVLDSFAAGDRIASGTAFMTDEISKFCAAYFDEGQSIWRLPGRGLRPYAARLWAWSAFVPSSMASRATPSMRSPKSFVGSASQNEPLPIICIRHSSISVDGRPTRGISFGTTSYTDAKTTHSFSS
jgi:hypothetical protein